MNKEQEEPKQETLEEAAEIFVNNRFTKQICGDESYPDICASKASIVESHILFAKCMQENSYSEEEVKKAYCDGSNLDYDIMISTKEGNEILEQWFKQFKKK